MTEQYTENQFDNFVSSLLGEMGETDAAAPTPAAPAETESADVIYPDDVEADTAPETPASGDEDEEQNETSEGESIEAPLSWSAEEKAKFRELPPDLQQYVATRESERDKAILRRTNELATERKAIEAETVRASQVQQQYAATINQLLTLTVPEIQELQKTDWQKLAVEDPSEYVRRTAQRDSLVQRVNFMSQEAQAAQLQYQQQLARTLEARKAEEFEKLTSEIPEFKEPGSEKAKSLVHEIQETGQAYGFTTQELDQIVDSRLVKALRDLAQYRKAQNARTTAQDKRQPAPAQRPIPNTAAPQTTRGGSKEGKINEQLNMLKKSNMRNSKVNLTARQQEDLAASLISNLL